MPDSLPSDSPPNAPTRLSITHAWLAETIRLRESLWGPLEDAAETRRARAAGGTLENRLLVRSLGLAQREGADVVLQRYTHGARWVLALLMLLAVLAGAGAALGALGDGSRSVNVLLALVALLGLNTLAFVFWLLNFALPHTDGRSVLGDLWLWLTRKLARGPDAALAPRALVSLLSRNATLRWVLGGISHLWWTTGLLSLLLTLLAILSARRYQFNWETTLLSPDRFVAITHSLGWLPAKLGFPVPTEAIIRASNGLQSLPESAHALWSGWLIGCVVVYGLLPRLAGLLASAWVLRHRFKRLSLDTTLPAYAELHDRLAPLSEHTGVDGPAGPWAPAVSATGSRPDYAPGQALVVGIELAHDTPWPPFALTEHTMDMGLIDTRHQRQQLLERFQQHPPGQLLAVCDPRQTPDRGTLALLAQLASLAHDMRILLFHDATPQDDHDTRLLLWRQQLTAAGFPPQTIYQQTDPALSWLTSKATP